MKKFGLLLIVSLALLGVQSSSFAQIRVLGVDSNTANGSEGVAGDGKEIIDPVTGDPIKCEPYDPFQYINELRTKTLDQYADQIAANLQSSLQACGGELLSSVADYTVPSIETIKANFFVQVQSFGFGDVTPETSLGDFADRVAQGISAKITCLSAIERQVLGIYISDREDERGRSLAMQAIWTLENRTTQIFYTELYTLMNEYKVWPDMNKRDPAVADDLKEIDSSGAPVNSDDAVYMGSSVNNTRVNSTKQERNN